MKLPQIQGDQYLADFFAMVKAGPGCQQIRETDLLATAFNRERLGRKRIVIMADCGHRVVTSNRKSLTCPRCVQMYKHGFDMDGFYKGLADDDLIWREDPCRRLNERTDLGGNFINDWYE